MAWVVEDYEFEYERSTGDQMRHGLLMNSFEKTRLDLSNSLEKTEASLLGFY